MTTRTRPHIEHLQRCGPARVECRWDPDHGALVPPGPAPHPVAASAPSAASERGAGAGLVTDVAARGAYEVAVHSLLCVGYVAGAPRCGDPINLGAGRPLVRGERHGATAC